MNHKVDHFLAKYGNITFMIVDVIRQRHKGILNLCKKQRIDCTNCPLCAACKFTKKTEETNEEYEERWEKAMREVYAILVGGDNGE